MSTLRGVNKITRKKKFSNKLNVNVDNIKKGKGNNRINTMKTLLTGTTSDLNLIEGIEEVTLQPPFSSKSENEIEMGSGLDDDTNEEGLPLANSNGIAVDALSVENEEYEVSAILDHKIERGASMFLVRWKGYTKDDDTWELEESLSCNDLINKFHRKKKTKAQQNGSGKKSPIKKKPKSKMMNEKKKDLKEWEVEKIIDFVEEKKGRMYRIRWKGYGSRYDTWEPESNLNCEKIIDKFMQSVKVQAQSPLKKASRGQQKKPKRLSNKTKPRSTNSNSLAGRKSKRSAIKKR